MWLLEADEIKDLKHHPKFKFQVRRENGTFDWKVLTYTADSSYYDNKKQEIVVEDVKGTGERGDDPVFKLKARIFKAVYGFDVHIVRKVK